MAILDIFNNDAFSLTNMMATVEQIDYRPGALGSYGIFTPNPVRTETVAIESRDGVLGLIQTSERGAPLDQRTTEKRKLRQFATTRIAKGDRITASELAFLRGFGEEQQVMMVQEEIARRLSGPAGLVSEIELTLEHMRLGAIQGIVLDADGSELVNWYDEFGVTAATEIAFDFANAVDGDIRKKTTEITRAMKRAAKGAWVPGTRIHALCGDTFWDQLISHSEIRQLFLNRDQSKYVENGGSYEQFTYGGITFENYQGTDDNSTVAIGSAEAKFFPVGAPGAFLEVFSPGEMFEHIGQLGQRLYPMIVRDDKRDMYADIEAYSYPLHVCTRPQMLQSARAGA